MRVTLVMIAVVALPAMGFVAGYTLNASDYDTGFAAGETARQRFEMKMAHLCRGYEKEDFCGVAALAYDGVDRIPKDR
jgi:hypothetical protein